MILRLVEQDESADGTEQGPHDWNFSNSNRFWVSLCRHGLYLRCRVFAKEKMSDRGKKQLDCRRKECDSRSHKSCAY